LFLTSYLLLERHGETVPAPQLERLARMIEFVAAYTKPNGLAPLIGDADDGRVQKLGGQALNDHRYLVSTGAVRFARADFKRAAGSFAEETFWLLGPDAGTSFDRLPDAAAPSSIAFPQGGFFVLRSATTHAVIDCGEVGMRGRGGHGHNDILSFELFINGMNVVTDSGAYIYTASREWRNRFRSTAFHNVAQVEDEEINRFVGADALWQLHDDARPLGVQWDSSGRGAYFGGSHNGYQRLLPPVFVRREMLMDTSGRVVVRDWIDGDGTRRLTWRFHLDPAVTPEIVDDTVRFSDGVREAWMTFADGLGRTVRIEPAWVSPSYGVRQPSRVLVIERTIPLPASLVCAFVARRPIPEDLCVKF